MLSNIIKASMMAANETNSVSNVLDCREENYSDLTQLPGCEGGELSSGEEEYDPELLWFDDYSSSTDSSSSEDTSVGSNEKSENFVADDPGQALSGNQSDSKGQRKRKNNLQGKSVVGRKKKKRGRAGLGRVTMVTKGYDSVDIPHELPPFKPSRSNGIHVENHLSENNMTTELEFFNLFFTRDMIDSIVLHTNAYAYLKIAEGSHFSYANNQGAWDETNAEEIKHFIALFIYFGLVKLDDIQKYWSTKSLYHGLWARKVLSRTRFQALMTFWHIADPSSKNPGDTLQKVESFVKPFKDQCKLLYQPTQNIAVQEYMVGCSDKPGIYRRYRRADNTIRSGIKLWLLADTSNGFTLDFNIYLGKSACSEVSKNGLGYDIVMKLAAPYFNQGYHLYLQDFFTSFKLVNDLFSNGIPSTGMVSVGMVGFPASLRDIKEWARTVELGGMRWDRQSNILTLQWMDHKPISIITTIDSANEVTVAHRKIKRGEQLQKIDVNVPKVIQKYNQCINKTHRLDQAITSNNALQKCYEWWKTFFFHLIDISIINSFILFQEHQKNNPDNKDLEREKHYTIVDFREALARQICSLADFDMPPAYQNVKPVHEYATIHIPKVADVRRMCKVCYKAGRGQCKVSTYCSAPQCQNFLHISKFKNCFEVWHSKEYHQQESRATASSPG